MTCAAHDVGATPPRPPAESYPRVSYRRIALLVFLAALALTAVNLPAVRNYLHDLNALKDTFQNRGIMGGVLFCAGAALLIAAGVPRLWLCLPAGGLFGFWRGLIWIHVATLIGSYLVFLFVRWTGLHWAARQLERYTLIKALTQQHTPLSVFLVRQLPIHGMVMNVALAASSIGHVDFLIGSFAGFLPQGVVVTLIGSGLGAGRDPRWATLQIVLAVLCGVIVLALLVRSYRRVRMTVTDDKEPLCE
jgi:uncharacterized membrane protein YdjX (TVP38/TMEM64 family)